MKYFEVNLEFDAIIWSVWENWPSAVVWFFFLLFLSSYSFVYALCDFRDSDWMNVLRASSKVFRANSKYVKSNHIHMFCHQLCFLFWNTLSLDLMGFPIGAQTTLYFGCSVRSTIRTKVNYLLFHGTFLLLQVVIIIMDIFIMIQFLVSFD